MKCTHVDQPSMVRTGEELDGDEEEEEEEEEEDNEEWASSATMTCMCGLDVMFWLSLSAIFCRSVGLSLMLYREMAFWAKASTSICTMAGISATVANLVRISLMENGLAAVPFYWRCGLVL